MNSEQLLIDKWRSLTSVQQQEVLDFVEFIAQKSLKENQSTYKSIYFNRRNRVDFCTMVRVSQ